MSDTATPAVRERRTVVLLAGPSGSGKSRLTLASGCPRLRLDDFYRDGDVPGLPRARGIVDWDDVATWDADAALEAMRRLADEGAADIPLYSIARNARVGTHRLELGASRCFAAEGIFAIDIAGRVQDAGLPLRAVYLRRPRWLTFLLRLRRDLRQHRKPPLVLLRRGWALARSEQQLRRRAADAGFEELSMRQARALLRRLSRPSPVSAPRTC